MAERDPRSAPLQPRSIAEETCHDYWCPMMKSATPERSAGFMCIGSVCMIWLKDPADPTYGYCGAASP